MRKNELIKALIEKVEFIYGKDYKEDFNEEIKNLINYWDKQSFGRSEEISEKSIYLITYGDIISEDGIHKLKTLKKFLDKEVKDTITDIHILPMFTYTSDDGFSIVDYMEINKDLGTWDDITRLSENYRLMFDFVANHTSKSCKWFKGYLNQDEKYKNYYIKESADLDTKNVIRPRTTPLFHKYNGKNGEITAWTTFSEDQVDVNFRNFQVFLEMTDILLSYAQKGASSIRLDAIGFIWKESGTSCMHLPQAHGIIQAWRLVLDYFKPNTQIITETNVPHNENISYLGNSFNEANMVYQFALPPLVLYTLTTHNSEKLSKWGKTIDKVSDKASYFNFLSSHDGIGLRPTEGILTDEDRQLLVNKVIENGGKISYKNNSNGTKSVYELNINYNDALLNKEDNDMDKQINKILASNAILLSFVGIPAIYYNSLLGSRNDYKGLNESGINRRINREKFVYGKIVDELENDYRRKSIFSKLKKLINLRKTQPAFSPYAFQRVLDLGESVFALERYNEKKNEKITFIINVDAEDIHINYDIEGSDIITGRKISNCIDLKPYEFIWIK